MKSHVSVLLSIAESIIIDGSAKCADVTLDGRDLITLRSRVEHEGLSFLTITLPTFGKDFDICLAKGQIDASSFRSFGKRRDGAIPVFLQGMLSRVFDEYTGRIKPDAEIPAIEGIRQIAYAFKKLEVACSPERVGKAISDFRFNEQCFEEPLVQEDRDEFIAVSRCLWGTVLGMDFNSILGKGIPKHGPGATAEKLSGNAKFGCRRWHDRLEPYFPLLDYKFANANSRFSEEFEKVSIVLEEDEQPVRVIPVPKTLKMPRIIAIEPVCMQYTQQALSKAIVNRLESHRITKGHLNFRDQSINRDLALMSSGNSMFATLDMSSASDLVPNELASHMFDSCPDLRDAVQACRSKKARLPKGLEFGPLSGEILPLSKFASMGSALCFPVEAMYFYTICVIALLKERNLTVTVPNVSNVGKSVYVYGDDIIVPTDESDAVVNALHKYYCKVNVRKSFSSGKFRESCGMDAFAGEDVTPTYIRQLCPHDRRSTKPLLSWLSASNHLYKRGYWKTAATLLNEVERLLGKLPIVGQQSPGLGKHSFQNVVSIDRWGTRYQRPEVRTWIVTPLKRPDVLDGHYALLKSLLRLEDPQENPVDLSLRTETGFEVPVDTGVDHLKRSVQRGAVVLKRRWTSPI